MKNALYQNHFFHVLLSGYSDAVYLVRYFAKSTQFTLTAMFRSWTILRAFAPREWKKRIAVSSTIGLVLIVSLVAFLTMI
ncbi:MAG: hypothetical protein JXA71_02315 [Chitinispirillaceae bacterium]|nr:hypothetical protein [Chitinispirillaceae bacterium]